MSDCKLTTQLERTEQIWSVLSQKLLAAAQLERYTAKISVRQ